MYVKLGLFLSWYVISLEFLIWQYWIGLKKPERERERERVAVVVVVVVVNGNLYLLVPLQFSPSSSATLSFSMPSLPFLLPLFPSSLFRKP